MSERFILGLSISHDSSAALADESGALLLGIAEERLSRVKGHVGLPVLAVARLLSELSPGDEITQVVIGSHGLLDQKTAARIMAAEAGNPSNPRGKWLQPGPGFRPIDLPPREQITQYLRSRFPELQNIDFAWVRHHDAHLATGLAWTSSEDRTLLVSLDGEGDGESGAVGLAYQSQITVLHRLTRGQSLGLMYAAVTERYNFIASRHEGKVLGLAARGEPSPAIDVLRKAFPVNRGLPRDRDLPGRGIFRGGWKVMSRLGLLPLRNRFWDDVMNVAEKQTRNYADLAFAAQRVLEERAEGIVRTWIEKTGSNSLVLTGGVFANVLLNQKLSRIEGVRKVRVVPDMGDSGLAYGGVLSYLASKGRGLEIPTLHSMFWAPEEREDDSGYLKEILASGAFEVLEMPDGNIALEAAKLLDSGAMVGIHQGRMEVGPRALGNRSVLVDARDPAVNARVNQRLNRTEFMPLAPAVLDEEFDTYFMSGGADIDYRFMTITADVRHDFHKIFPGIVHVDGTARPQLVTEESNRFLHEILREFKGLTGVGLLVNTSMNVHEQPINYRLRESIHLLSTGTIEALVFERTIIKRRANASPAS